MMTFDQQEINKQIENDFSSVNTFEQLEELRIKYLSRKGIVSGWYGYLASLPNDQKPLFGQKINVTKQKVVQKIESINRALKEEEKKNPEHQIDVTLPGIIKPIGHLHIINQVIDEICSLFESMGFVVNEGPEIETEFYNFDALNIPFEHPARDGFDTFYVDISDSKAKQKKKLLRSQTSPVQIRVMQQYKPPIAVIVPGKVYRPDSVDATHSFMFHQIEGLLVDKHISFADLKGLLTTFCKKLFGSSVKMRFRPHYFPFTEPSAEVDISAEIIGRKGWLEIMGCGLVHPHVFKAVKYPDNTYQGLAFGLGVERIAMLKYGIKDIRTFYENDKRFINQF